MNSLLVQAVDTDLELLVVTQQSSLGYMPGGHNMNDKYCTGIRNEPA
jgi:hypothetical protein